MMVHDGIEAIVAENEKSVGLFLPSVKKKDIFGRIETIGVFLVKHSQWERQMTRDSIWNQES